MAPNRVDEQAFWANAGGVTVPEHGDWGAGISMIPLQRQPKTTTRLEKPRKTHRQFAGVFLLLLWRGFALRTALLPFTSDFSRFPNDAAQGGHVVVGHGVSEGWFLISWGLWVLLDPTVVPKGWGIGVSDKGNLL